MITYGVRGNTQPPLTCPLPAEKQGVRITAIIKEDDARNCDAENYVVGGATTIKRAALAPIGECVVGYRGASNPSLPWIEGGVVSGCNQFKDMSAAMSSMVLATAHCSVPLCEWEPAAAF
ncbi:hypothetical protein D9C73_004130 [Collichthys lucidus]|uniref:Uncharacterized protein n=1 Tax=Collichthys lucidus TaxID=240159 RepID=A0A4U5U724_COLLU|nr:hypothetical protein D9C73_004130 [Collichthys lucidus]